MAGWQKRAKKYRRKIALKKLASPKLFLIFLAGLALTVFLTYLFFISPVFQIEKIKIIGGTTDLRAKIKKDISPKINTKFLYFFQSKSTLLLHTSVLTAEILRKYPNLASVNFHRFLPGTLILELKLKIPEAIYCKNQDQCFFIDKNGIVFQKTNKNSRILSKSLPVIIFNKNEPLLAGEKLIAKKEINEISIIYQTLKQSLGLNIQSFLLSPNKLTLLTEKGWAIYLKRPDDNFKLDLIKIELLLKKEISSQERKNLKYIDLRFSKAYYK